MDGPRIVRNAIASVTRRTVQMRKVNHNEPVVGPIMRAFKRNARDVKLKNGNDDDMWTPGVKIVSGRGKWW